MKKDLDPEIKKSPKPDKVPNFRRRILITKNRGLTLVEYERLVSAQKGACAICGSKNPKTNRMKRFCIDHDHKSGEIRGLLCASCNSGIGLLGDDPKKLMRAVRYLTFPTAYVLNLNLP